MGDELILQVHTMTGCRYCKYYLSPEGQKLIKDAAKSIPIRYINHTNWHQLHLSEDYPNTNIISFFPAFVLIPERDAHRDGRWENAHIWQGKYDSSLNAILEDKSSKISLTDWLKKYGNENKLISDQDIIEISPNPPNPNRKVHNNFIFYVKQ